MPHIIERDVWATDPENWQGEVTGKPYGTNVSVIFNHQERVGAGPRLHKHPYTETFIIRKGCARFTVGNEIIDAHEGQIVVSPANTPHKFENLGPGTLETIDIHANEVFVTEWLE
jgi:mannose-6-phosphate isomerase-like protein (cupin superfamily)